MQRFQLCLSAEHEVQIINVAVVLRVAPRKKSFLGKRLRTAHMHSPVSKRPINFIIKPRNILQLECLVIVGMLIGMYGDTCVVAPHLGCLNEVAWMRGHNLCLSGRC